MILQRLVVHPVLSVLTLLLGSLLAAIGPAEAAKPFPVDQFSYFISDYEAELSRLAPQVTRSASEIEGDIAAAKQAGNARLAAASLEQLLTRRPADGSLWLDLAQQLIAATPLNDSDGYAIPGKVIMLAGSVQRTQCQIPAIREAS